MGIKFKTIFNETNSHPPSPRQLMSTSLPTDRAIDPTFTLSSFLLTSEEAEEEHEEKEKDEGDGKQERKRGQRRTRKSRNILI